MTCKDAGLVCGPWMTASWEDSGKCGWVCCEESGKASSSEKSPRLKMPEVVWIDAACVCAELC